MKQLPALDGARHEAAHEGALPQPPSGRTGWPWTAPIDDFDRADGRTWPRISIITPSYNQGIFLEAAIRSVLLQGYPDLEYIVIDGGSIDESPSILRKYEPWLSFWISEPDDGQTYAIAKGMARASGVVVNWLNADDLLWPGALQRVAEAWRRAPRSNCVLCGDSVTLDAAGRVVARSEVRRPREKILPSAPPFIGGEQASWFLSREAWESAGGIDLSLDFTMDTDLMYRAAASGAWFEPVGETVAAYREHDATKTRTQWRRSMAFKKRLRYRWLEHVPPNERRTYERRICRELFGHYLQHVTVEDSLQVRLEKITAAVRTYPRGLLVPHQLRRMSHLLIRGTF